MSALWQQLKDIQANPEKLGPGYQLDQFDKKPNLKHPRTIKFISSHNTATVHASSQSASQMSHKRFTPICHFCQKPGHVRPKCFKRWKLIQRHLEANSFMTSSARRLKIDLKNSSQQKIWVQKSDICFFTNYCCKNMCY